MNMQLSDYLTSPAYRRNSKHLANDIDLLYNARNSSPPWWHKYKPSSRSWVTKVFPHIVYPSYWSLAFIAKTNTIGARAHKINLGVDVNKNLTNDKIRSQLAARMMNKVNNAKLYLGNEALYKHK